VGEEDGEWEVELVSAVVEALGSEEESKDAVHRADGDLGISDPTLAFLSKSAGPTDRFAGGRGVERQVDGRGKAEGAKEGVGAGSGRQAVQSMIRLLWV